MKTMKHLIHILIISAILLGLAFCFGCKEKAEANEPECKHENIGPSNCLVNHPAGYVCEQCYDCWEYINLYKPNEPDPNEYETEGYNFNIWEPNDTTVVSLDFIPTWPDYIELEKELWFDIKTVLDPNTMVLYEKIGFPKGTKIYFKDKAE